MLVMYFFILFSLLSISNVYMIWLLMELMFLFFFLYVMSVESKSVGLIIYFFFQSVASLILFMMIVFMFDKLIFVLLSAKLGSFPFFYWMVVVSVKVGLIGNLFVLSLQKVSVFRLLWLLLKSSLSFVYMFMYSSIFFVVLNLLLISDLWLLLVYSSIANTGMIVLSIYGSNYLGVVILYLSVIFFIIYCSMKLDNYMEFILVIFFFMVIPPFLLFFMKLYVVMSLDYMMKLGFFLFIFDVLILFYYFSLIFMKFLLMDMGVVVYLMNLLLIILVLFLSNCVTMVIFY